MDRLNVLDAEFLHLEDQSWHMHIAGLCVFEGPAPTLEEISGAVAARLPLIPRYRRRVRFLPFELGRPVWVDDVHFDLANHVRRVRAAEPGDDAALCAVMGSVMSRQLDREHPLWEIWLVEGLAGGRWGLITKIHHAMVDGIAGVDLHTMVFDERPDAPRPAAPPPWTPEREPSSVELVLDAWNGLFSDARAEAQRAFADLLHPADAARAALATAAGFATFTSRLLEPAWGPIQGTIGPERSYAHASVPIGDVQTIRKALGGSLNDVALAAASGGYRALFEKLGERPDGARLRSLVPVSVRAPDEHGVLHNRVSALLCDLPLHIADPALRLRAVSRETARLKASHMAEAGAWLVHTGDLAPPMVVGALTRGIARLMHYLPNSAVGTVTTNVPGPRAPLYFLGRRMVEWFPYVPIALGVRVGTAILSYAGQLTFGVTTDRATIPDAGLLARAIAAGIDELLAAARHATREPPVVRRPASGATAPSS